MRAEFKTPAGRRRQYNKKAYAKRKALAAVAAIPAVASSKKVSPSVKAYVSRAIDRKAEDKHDITTVFSNQNCLGNGFDSTATNQGLSTVTSIIPVINQGNAVDQRQGNRINVKSFTARLILTARPVSTDNSVAGLPFYVRVVFYNRKDSMTNNTNNTILDLGGSSTGFAGSLASLLLKYNKDTFNIIKSYTFKMAPCQSVSGTGVSSAENMPNGFVSHIYKNITLPISKKLVYDDTTSQPNQRIFCAIGVVNADNSSVQPAVTGYRLRVSMDTHLVYEDF